MEWVLLATFAAFAFGYFIAAPLFLNWRYRRHVAKQAAAAARPEPTPPPPPYVEPTSLDDIYPKLSETKFKVGDRVTWDGPKSRYYETPVTGRILFDYSDLRTKRPGDELFVCITEETNGEDVMVSTLYLVDPIGVEPAVIPTPPPRPSLATTVAIPLRIVK